MPYTFMHPVFVAPLKQRWPRIFDSSALIMGSIAPDVDIIYRFTNTRHHIFDYSLGNIITMILPIAVVLSLFMKMVMIPVYTSGYLHFSRPAAAPTLRMLPSVIFSSFIAILIHLMLDNVTHIDNIVVKAQYHAENLGRDPDDYHDFYYLMMYGPTLVVSGIGLLIGLWYVWQYRSFLRTYTAFLRSNFRDWSVIFLLIMVSFSLLKHITVGVEDQMRLDSYAISITCGLLSAFLLSPVLYYIRFTVLKKMLSQLNDLSPTWYFTLMPISGCYLAGIPDTEWLREFVLKGIFLLSLSAIILLIRALGSRPKFHYSLYNWLAILILSGLYILIIKISPAWWWVKLILAFQGVTTFMYLVAAILFPGSNLFSFLNILSGGWMLFVLAYYISDKGLGPGIAVVALMGWLFSIRNYLAEKAKPESSRYLMPITWVETLLLMAIFLHLRNPAGLLILTIGILLTYLRKWGTGTIEWAQKFNIIYYWWFPVAGILYMGSHYSISYGLLSLSAFLIFFPFVFSQVWDAYRREMKEVKADHV